jgi:DNA mismatch endonuclease, patch repair protein
MDRLTKEQRSLLMSRIRSVSKLELAARPVASKLAGCRLRHGKNKSALPGSPDYFNKSKKTAVFVHGCFFHGCGQCRDGLRVPKSNTEYWAVKIARNRARDGAALAAYARMGWNAIVIWEHSLRQKGNHENIKNGLHNSADFRP